MSCAKSQLAYPHLPLAESRRLPQSEDAAEISCPLPRGEHFVMVEVYADESGIHAGSKRLAVCGYSGGRRPWVSFEKAWAIVLKDFSIPEDKGFKASKFFARDAGRRISVYEDWSQKRAKDYLDALLKVINDHHIHQVGAVLEMAFYNSLTEEQRRWLTGGIFDNQKYKWVRTGAPAKPYFLPFQQIVVAGASYAKPGIKADFIFDRQDSFRKHALNMWNQMKDQKWDTAARLGQITFASRFERIALQAADLLAYCIYHKDAYAPDTSEREIRYAIHGLIKKGCGVKRFDSSTMDLLTTSKNQFALRINEDKEYRDRAIENSAKPKFGSAL